MQWEYKRIVINGSATVSSNTHRRSREEIKQAAEAFEAQLHELGQAGWELATAVVIEGTQNSMKWNDSCIVEYIFKKPLA